MQSARTARHRSSRSRHDVRRSSCRRGQADPVREDTVQPSVHGLPLGARPRGDHHPHQGPPGRGLVASHVDQPWAPPTVDGALALLKPVYDRWLAWKTTVDLTGKRYVEVRAED